MWTKNEPAGAILLWHTKDHLIRVMKNCRVFPGRAFVKQYIFNNSKIEGVRKAIQRYYTVSEK